jgi:hypothetical protein
VTADGTLSATFSIQYGGGSGTTTDQFGPATATGTRIAVEPMASQLTPMTPPASTAPASTAP